MLLLAWWNSLFVCILLFHACQAGQHGYNNNKAGRAGHDRWNRRIPLYDAVQVGIRSAIHEIKQKRRIATSKSSLVPSVSFAASSSSSSPSESMTCIRYAIVQPDEREMINEIDTADLIRSRPFAASKTTTFQEHGEKMNELQCLERQIAPCSQTTKQQQRGYFFHKMKCTGSKNVDCGNENDNMDDEELAELENQLFAQKFCRRSPFKGVTRKARLGSASTSPSVVVSSSPHLQHHEAVMPVVAASTTISSSSTSSASSSARRRRRRSGEWFPNRRRIHQERVDSLSLAPTQATTSTSSPSSSSSSSSSTKSVLMSSATIAATAAATVASSRPLIFWESMICGAISRSVAQTVMHPANTMKTILQSGSSSSLRSLLQPSNFRRLTQGAGANFVLSVPHGAINFAVLELVRHKLQTLVQTVPRLRDRSDAIGPGLDFMSSAISTICCSIVSTPQMMICDNIMAGNYNNLPQAVHGLMQNRGLAGFYAGWWPGLVGKIPSYALTWTLFQQLKKVRFGLTHRPAGHIENSVMGCIASATTVSIMIPMDTIKTRLVAQTGRAIGTTVPYKGIVDCAVRMLREEGVESFYRGLPPRLISVVPMIGIQFGVYEAMRRFMVKRAVEMQHQSPPLRPAQAIQLGNKNRVGAVEGMTGTTTTMPQLQYGQEQILEEALMEVAAGENLPNPAPHFLIKMRNGLNGNGKLKDQSNTQKKQR